MTEIIHLIIPFVAAYIFWVIVFAIIIWSEEQKKVDAYTRVQDPFYAYNTPIKGGYVHYDPITQEEKDAIDERWRQRVVEVQKFQDEHDATYQFPWKWTFIGALFATMFMIIVVG